MKLGEIQERIADRRLSRRSLIRGLTAGAVAGAGAVGLAACGGSGSGNNGLSTGRAEIIAREITTDEQEHVSFLRTALGENAVAKPAINLSAMDGTLNNFLTLARAFEDVGVSAYGGAAPSLAQLDNTPGKSLLGYAAQILATEAYHAGNIRLQIAERGVSVAAVDPTLDVVPPPAGQQYFTTGANALAVVRTPQQVVAIVTSYFPSGINGVYPPATAIDILNFALNLEYLEAEFYTYATTGAGITSAGIAVTGIGTAGATTGGKRVSFS